MTTFDNWKQMWHTQIQIFTIRKTLLISCMPVICCSSWGQGITLREGEGPPYCGSGPLAAYIRRSRGGSLQLALDLARDILSAPTWSWWVWQFIVWSYLYIWIYIHMYTHTHIYTYKWSKIWLIETPLNFVLELQFCNRYTVSLFPIQQILQTDKIPHKSL